MQFTIKSHTDCTDRAQIPWKTIQASYYFTDDLKLVVDDVIKNGYFFQIIILTLLVDSNQYTRK